ncbi:alpha/beta hydrolase [Rothia terrae]|uniref:Alpha/beta fold hydrolase n=1 Tax=Rothia terrae TaxID=396015 RepID=A0A7H2BBS4_9MICC|nr:alpha/beta fold hydrolase [Rothia terrae]QNV37120.1 alpha/beta fold hydrolase [Rothia terrae]
MDPLSLHEPMSHATDSSVGVLVLHGFTGSTFSMRPVAEFFADRGYAVEMPLLPGHGTTWQDMDTYSYQDWVEAVDQAYWRLQQRKRKVVVFGLSMGGTLALVQAARRDVDAVIVVNPFVKDMKPTMRFAHLLARFTPALDAIGSDIQKPDTDEHGYQATPLLSVRQLHLLGKEARRSLRSIICPVLVFKSREDHVIPVSSVEHLRQCLPHTRVVHLDNSYHVATLDYDAPTIFARSLEFIEELDNSSR